MADFLCSCSDLAAASEYVVANAPRIPADLRSLAEPVGADCLQPFRGPSPAKRIRAEDENEARPHRVCLLGAQPRALQHVALTVLLGELANLPARPLCQLAVALSRDLAVRPADGQRVFAHLVALLCARLCSDCHELLSDDEIERLHEASECTAALLSPSGSAAIAPTAGVALSWAGTAHRRAMKQRAELDVAPCLPGGHRAGEDPNLETDAAAESYELPRAVRQRCEALKLEIVAFRAGRGVTARQRQVIGSQVVAVLRAQVSEAATGSAVSAACGAMQLCDAGDDLLSDTCTHFVSNSLSRPALVSFVGATLLPRVRSLSAPAPRVLMNAIVQVVKTRPEVIVDTLLLPMLCADECLVGSAQCELAIRVARTIPLERQEELLLGLSVLASSAGGGCDWTDLTLPVVTTVLTAKFSLGTQTAAALITKIEHAAESQRVLESQKFAMLLHTLITKHEAACLSHAEVLEAILRRSTSFMAKPTLAALSRARKRNRPGLGS